MIDLRCRKCSSLFRKELKAYNQALKRGWPSEYCSRRCANQATGKAPIIVECFNCGKSVKKTQSAIRRASIGKGASGRMFCSRSCSTTCRNRERIGPLHPNFSGGVKAYRKSMGRFCCDCGEEREYLLVVHHIDGNRGNRQEENLETVCGNCHTKRHLVNFNGRWVFNSHHLTPREMLVKL